MKTVMKIVLGIVIAFILIAAGCTALVGSAVDDATTPAEVSEVDESAPEPSKSDKSASDKESDEGVVVLRVTGKGTSRASITFADPNMEMTQETNARLPWTKKFKVSDLGIIGFSITAQNNNASGQISCSIRDGEETLSENTSKGGYAVVTCN